MKFVSNLFFTDIDFCKPDDIQDLDLNFNLYFLTFLRGGEVSCLKTFWLNYHHLVHQFLTNPPSQQKNSIE